MRMRRRWYTIVLFSVMSVVGLSLASNAAHAQTVAKSKLFGAQAPSSMENVFRNPKKPKQAARPFNANYYCGRYDVKLHLASICVLENGRVFGGVPPHIDQNDRIHVYVIVRKWLSHLYKVEIAPRKLLQVLPTSEVIPEKELKPDASKVFVVKKYVFGPFRERAVQLVVSRPAIGRAGLGRVYTVRLIRINPLVQFNIAVAFIGVTPVKTRFGLFRERGSSITRIARKESGQVTLDFILIAKFYAWQIWDSKMFAGRDVLKPPTFLERFNLNIGFSFQDLFTSFYLGVGFEINAGLDIVVGVNLRAVDVLSGGFEVGNPFSGDETEIPVRQEIQPAFYVGLSITPEIFRSIFRLLSSNSLFGA